MKINIENKNKIENSNIGENNVIHNNDEKNNIFKIVIEVCTGIIVTVIGGYILYKLNIN